ncbi:PAS domain-containing protein [Streptomyces iconiensis]|uniref:PAS domain-containing protein n=1 Tax=Streptomyces iconiensis TaxID=1384038 RepID=A0ABT6ZV45_9ACTN|nr:PAS domain-containing protein [Streptomyces iconiensis]MDJ1132684.1 PAS domain-containing protein [Streptomyces iconiensis]
MTGVNEFGTELADFRRRVDELKSARALPGTEPLPTLDAALFELQHAVDVLWPRVEALVASKKPSGDHSDAREQQTLRALFQRLPVAVALLDRDGVVRRLNVAAAELFGIGAGYASGRALTGALAHSSRAAFRSQVAAVARGEGSRSLRVQLLRAPHGETAANGELRVTLSELRPPREQRSAVLSVFQLVAHAAPSALASTGTHTGVPRPGLAEMSRHTELLDVVDDMAAELLVSSSAHEATERAAAVLHERFADWVIVDRRCTSGRLRRHTVLGSGDTAHIREEVAAQDPSHVPVVADAAERGSESLLVRPEDPEALGRDSAGAPVLVSTEVSSLLCVPLTVPPSPSGREGRTGRRTGGRTMGALTLLRTGGRRTFELAEAGAVDRMARHLALALRRYE